MDLDFQTMPIADVFRYREDLKQQLEHIKNKQADMNKQLELRFGNYAKEKLNSENKDYGSTTLNEGGFKVKVTLRQKVTWDQDGLVQTFMNDLSEDDAKHYAKITYGIDERKYNSAPPAIKDKLQKHRTVQLMSTSIDITDGS
jgi:hypothetical protein|tara:strand:- start:127 stop:555 length:429 start_codon:yes stop_codon:yes gene_type:complete